jgi:hypothetical protein
VPVNVRMRQFEDICLPIEYCASNKGSLGRCAVKWRKAGGNFLGIKTDFS